MYLKEIRVENLQSIDKASITLRPTGLTRFKGPNSNGKSVIGKALGDLIYARYTKPTYRKDIIRTGSTSGSLTLVREDDSILQMSFALEAAETRCTLIRADGSVTTGNIASKAIPSIVKEFGLHCMAGYPVSLNLHEDDDPPLAVKTSLKLNYDLLSSVLGDEDAETSLENITNERKQLRDLEKYVSNQLAQTEASLQMLPDDDVEVMKSRYKSARNLVACCKRLQIFDLPDLLPIPEMYVIPHFEMRSFKYPLLFVYNTEMGLDKMEDMLHEFDTIKKGVCPTCKREFYL